MIEKSITHIFDVHLIICIGEHRHTSLGKYQHAAGAGLLVAPAVLPFRIEIKPVAGPLHRRHLVTGPDQFRDHTFDQGGLPTVRPTDKRDNRYSHEKGTLPYLSRGSMGEPPHTALLAASSADSATGEAMPTHLARVSGDSPDFSAQQLNRYQIARAHSFNFDGNIDQTIGLHHGR